MPQLSESIDLLLLRDASVEMIDQALTAVADATPHPEKLRNALYERRLAMLAGDHPEALWLLEDCKNMVGWVGWAPYKERDGCWQTTTYVASSLRGTGLFDRARCLQLHAADIVSDWASTRSHSPVTFLLSIADWNIRSIAASKRYVESNNWPDTWERVFEPIANRDAHVYVFPYPDAPHTCYKTANGEPVLGGANRPAPSPQLVLPRDRSHDR